MGAEVADANPGDVRAAHDKAVQEKMERAVKMAKDIIGKSRLPSFYSDDVFSTAVISMALVLYRDLP